jgi:hypothetical protein
MRLIIWVRRDIKLKENGKMKKRWLLGCLAGAMAVSLCACGGSAVSEEGADGGSASVKEESNVTSSDNSKLEDLGLEYNDEVKLYISSGVYLRFAVPYKEVENNAYFDWSTSSGYYIMKSEESCDSDYASVLCSFNSIGSMSSNSFNLYLGDRYEEAVYYPSTYDETNKTVEESSSYTNANGLDAVVEKGHVQWTDDNSVGASHSLYYTDCYIDYGQDQDFILMLVDLTEDESKADFIDEVMAATVDSFVVEDTN